jgi:hypothetical protein
MKALLTRLPRDQQQIAGTNTLGREMLDSSMKTGIGMTIVIDRLRDEEDKDIAIAISKDINRQTTAAVVVHVEGSLDSAQRVVRSCWKAFPWI